MGIRIEVDVPKKRAVVRAVQTLDLKIILDSLDELYAHPDFGPGFDQLVDLGDCHVDLGAGSGTQLAQAIVSRGTPEVERLTGARIACISNRDYVFGMLRMVEMTSADLPLEFRVFREPSDAEAWLESPHDESTLPVGS